VTPFSEKNLGKFWQILAIFLLEKKGIGGRIFFLNCPFGDFQPEKDWFLNHNNGHKPSIIL
jgi:hypothetical protein